MWKRKGPPQRSHLVERCFTSPAELSVTIFDARKRLAHVYCQAPYAVVRVETDEKEQLGQVNCTECSFPFSAYENGSILKYFKTASSNLRALRK